MAKKTRKKAAKKAGNKPDLRANERSMVPELDEKLLKDMSDMISDYIHGKAREHIVTSLAQATNKADVVSTMAYQIVGQAFYQVNKKQGATITIDMLIVMATETIDFLIEILDAIGEEYGDPQDFREETLIKVMIIHSAKVENIPQAREAAKRRLEQMMESGELEESMDYVEKRMKEKGGDPNMIKRLGEDMAKDPVAAGVQRGLRG